MDHTHQNEEPFANSLSNIAYAIAAIPYALHGSALGYATALALVVLAVGSGGYHYYSTWYWRLGDHLGMHLALPCVTAFTAVISIGPECWVIAPLLICAAAIPFWDPEEEGMITTKHSRKMLAFHGLFFLVSLLFLWTWITLAVPAFFAIGFMLHNDHQDTPSHFGKLHAGWHVLTAIALMLPAFA